jgi:hypothetical protein
MPVSILKKPARRETCRQGQHRLPRAPAYSIEWQLSPTLKIFTTFQKRSVWASLKDARSSLSQTHANQSGYERILTAAPSVDRRPEKLVSIGSNWIINVCLR